MPDPLLVLAHVGKTFGATRALAKASLELHAGEVTALIGENGAGKSTLVKMLAGLYQPDTGEIRIDGQPVRIDSPAAARKLGISIVHQESLLFDNLSVAENVLIDAIPRRRGLIDHGELMRRAADVLRQLDPPFTAAQLVGELSVAQKHLVQIARGLSHSARIVVLDEPTAALSHREAQDLYRVVERLKSAGCAILLISHRFEEIFASADRYVVFRDGCDVGCGRIGETNTQQLIDLMVGRTPPPWPSSRDQRQSRGRECIDQTSVFTSPPPVAGGGPGWGHPATSTAEILRVENLSRDREFLDISFSVRSGEILGFYGLVGAGRSEVMQCLFGLTRPEAGRVLLQGRDATAITTGEAIANGLAYVPEDRQHQGAILPFSIASNIALPNQKMISRFGMQHRSAVAELANKWIAALQIKANSPHQNVDDLSGGNQQKVVLAKWLATQPQLLIVDEPTKGIDVGAKAAVHEVMRNLAATGIAIVMVSSDLPEVLGMSDRVIVMRRGRVRARLDRSEASAENLAQAATAA
jgi:rhamnose transport system ATP-binding protein